MGGVALTNALLIVADDMRADLLPYMPFVNGSLRPQGAQLTNMRCNVPACNPSRAGLLTGQYARGAANGVYQNVYTELANATEDSLPVWLSDQNVTTGMFGKYLLGLGDRVQPGWDTWRVLSVDEQEAFGYTITDGTTASKPTDHQLRHLADEVSSFVATAPEPWFAYFAPTNPHVNTRELSNNPLPSSVTLFGWLRWPFTLLADTTGKPSWIASRDQFTDHELSAMRHLIRQQVREVSDLDAVIAQLCNELARAGRMDDTVIILVSDSGVFYGEQRLGDTRTSTKEHPYDAVCKTPCVLRGPGIPVGAVATTPAVLQDVTATLLAVFGATATVPQDGVDLRQLITAPDPARTTLYERKGDATFPDGVGVVTSTRKLLHWPGQGGDDEYEAYDLDADPDELVNWANDAGRSVERRALAAQLEALLT